MTELDEGEREEFFRLKKIQKNKEKHREAAAHERQKWLDKQIELVRMDNGVSAKMLSEPLNLADTTDQDLLF